MVARLSENAQARPGARPLGEAFHTEKVWDAKGNCTGEKHFFAAVDKDGEVYTVNDSVKVHGPAGAPLSYERACDNDNDPDPLQNRSEARATGKR